MNIALMQTFLVCTDKKVYAEVLPVLDWTKVDFSRTLEDLLLEALTNRTYPPKKANILIQLDIEEVCIAWGFSRTGSYYGETLRDKPLNIEVVRAHEPLGRLGYRDGRFIISNKGSWCVNLLDQESHTRFFNYAKDNIFSYNTLPKALKDFLPDA